MPAEPKPQEDMPKTIGTFLMWVLKRIAKRKRWLLLPLWILLAIVALLILMAGGSAILPVIYIG